MTAPDTHTLRAAFAKKMAVVLAEAGRIPKSGYNKTQDYHYIREADVIETMREVIHAAGLSFGAECTSAENVFTGKTANGGDKIVTRAVCEFTYTDTDTGYTESYTCVGDGADNSDKGIYKAITGATKYHLYKMFLLPTGDDPEAESHGSTGGGNTAARPAATGGTPATTPGAPPCPKCGATMKKRTRKSDGGEFWGCPVKVGDKWCGGIVNVEDAEMQADFQPDDQDDIDVAEALGAEEVADG